MTPFDVKEFRLTRKTSLEQIKAWAENPYREVVYSVMTPWWSIAKEGWMPYRLNKNPTGYSIPCDPTGSPLCQGNLARFLEVAGNNLGHYGRNGIDALVAAFHGNVVVEKTGQPTALSSWDRYNDLIDFEKAGRTI